jgi:hypothetical protein
MEDEYGSGIGTYLEIIGTYFSFVEIGAIGLMFWISCGTSGALILICLNMLCTTSEVIRNSSSWLVKIYDFIKGWMISTLSFILIGLVFCCFLLYGILATWLLNLICNILGVNESINFLGTSIGMTVAFILGNIVALVKTLSKQIRWLECKNEYPEDYEMRSQKFKNLKSYLLDLKEDNIGGWPRR